MARLIQLSEKSQRVRALFPQEAKINTWYELQNGFRGCLLDNGSIDLKHKVKLTADSPDYVWRIDRVTAKGNEKFIGYQPMTSIESAIF